MQHFWPKFKKVILISSASELNVICAIIVLSCGQQATTIIIVKRRVELKKPFQHVK